MPRFGALSPRTVAKRLARLESAGLPLAALAAACEHFKVTGEIIGTEAVRERVRQWIDTLAAMDEATHACGPHPGDPRYVWTNWLPAQHSPLWDEPPWSDYPRMCAAWRGEAACRDEANS